MGQKIFSEPELALLAPAMRVARDLAGQHYALPDSWFDDVSHHVCTVREQRRGEILGCGYLAHIRRVLRVTDDEMPVLRCRRFLPHYRICLQDHNLLQRVRQLPQGDLEILLTAVITHEYVHMVRFGRLQHPYRASAQRRAGEERRVEEITRHILLRHGHGRLRRAAC